MQSLNSLWFHHKHTLTYWTYLCTCTYQNRLNKQSNRPRYVHILKHTECTKTDWTFLGTWTYQNRLNIPMYVYLPKQNLVWTCTNFNSLECTKVPHVSASISTQFPHPQLNVKIWKWFAQFWVYHRDSQPLAPGSINFPRLFIKCSRKYLIDPHVKVKIGWFPLLNSENLLWFY